MATAAATRTPAQLFALVFGVVYLLVGVVGFFVTGFDGFASANGFEEKLIIFALNPLHNIVHIALGAVWIGASRTHAAAKGINMLFGVVLLLVFVVGMLGVVDDLLAIEDASAADNYLHLLTGALAVYFGSAGAEATGSPATT